MTTISEHTSGALDLELTWKSDVATHTEAYRAEHVNFWRDIFPKVVTRQLIGSQPKDRLQFLFSPGEMMPSYAANQVFNIPTKQFERPRLNGHRLEPRTGRFYPRGLLKGLPNIYDGNVEPFRCIGVNGSKLSVDLNHPLADRATELQGTVVDVQEKDDERGGRLTDWVETITNGPGMQARSGEKPTDFFSDDPFMRKDDSRDPLFYAKPRLVTHIDSQAQTIIKALYGRYLRPGMHVLDLLSSWRSHVPESPPLGSLVGLGLNAEEMADNPQLTEYVVHDLNTEPRLPFEGLRFDAVICTVSVEYMTRPFEVFRDVARILRPEGLFIHTFSNRWFPPKAIRIWEELSEFERMGLVSEYFLESGLYDNLKTYSARGWPRPETDRYYPGLLTADPVYAVLGQTVR
jgi:SAM-dependent methyltransferase